MKGLIGKLEEWNARDTRVRAVLRRSLGFEPGSYPPGFPYVEWSLSEDDGHWRRTVAYLVAGLWAQHWREGRGKGTSIGVACSLMLRGESGSSSVEKRFIQLLDADEEQVPYRLRQMVALLKNHDLDFERLHMDLLGWGHSKKFVQSRWAREFYASPRENEESEPSVTNTDAAQVARNPGSSVSE